MTNTDILDTNVKLFFKRFSKAVSSKDEKELNRLIADEYESHSLMNRNKEQLISFIIRTIPKIPLLRFELKIDILQVDKDQETNNYRITIKPKYTYKLLGLIDLVTGIFGRAETVYVSLEKNPETDLYWIASMEEITT